MCSGHHVNLVTDCQSRRRTRVGNLPSAIPELETEALEGNDERNAGRPMPVHCSVVLRRQEHSHIFGILIQGMRVTQIDIVRFYLVGAFSVTDLHVYV